MNIAYRHRRHRLALFVNEGLTQTIVIERFLTTDSLMFVSLVCASRLSDQGGRVDTVVVDLLHVVTDSNLPAGIILT